jgi:hypothetical protein
MRASPKGPALPAILRMPKNEPYSRAYLQHPAAMSAIGASVFLVFYRNLEI